MGEVPAYIAAADVAVLPSTNAFSSPMKLFEYLAAGRAVVAPRLSQITAVVEDEHDALLVPEGDVDAYAAALRRLAADVGLRRQLGDNGRAKVLAQHTWTSHAREVLERARAVA
jgi:glycosyltransferase involved in cell wall biosynthesis